MAVAHKDKEIFSSPKPVIPGCTTQYSLPTELDHIPLIFWKNFEPKELVGIVHPGISWVVILKAISSGQVKVLELKLTGRCSIPG